MFCRWNASPAGQRPVQSWTTGCSHCSPAGAHGVGVGVGVGRGCGCGPERVRVRARMRVKVGWGVGMCFWLMFVKRIQVSRESDLLHGVRGQ